MAHGHEHHAGHTPNEHGHDLEQHIHPDPTNPLLRYVFSFDHKVIAKQFLYFGMFWTIIGIMMSVMIRWTQAYPGEAFPLIGKLMFPHSNGVIPPEYYTVLFTMHGTIMIFFALTPVLIGAFGNLCIPLMIGARDMIFPWLNMASFWVMMISGVIMLWSLFVPLGASAVGWTSYPTLANKPWSPGSGHTLWLISMYFAGTSSIMGAINYIATIIRLRAPGMTWFKLPITIWGLFLTAILNALFLPVLASGFLLLLMDRAFGTHFFMAGAVAQNGTQGDPILFQHLFWIFGHPEVYILILPGWGFIGDFLSFFSRKPAFNYKGTVVSMISITVLSMLVYGHHMFTTNMAPLLMTAFTTLTLMISIPSAVFFCNWLGTMWRGSIQLTSPMLFTLGAVFTFGIGGLTGLQLAAISTDMMLHNTYFVVGHFHLTMASASLLSAFAAVYYWFPKMFGRMMDEKLARLQFALLITVLFVIFTLMMVVGYKGMPRRYYNPYEYLYLKDTLVYGRILMAMAALGFLSLLVFFVNFFWSVFKGPKAEQNPWKVGTLEWQTPIIPPHHNFDVIPEVHIGPHEFSHPNLKDRDWAWQTEKL